MRIAFRKGTTMLGAFLYLTAEAQSSSEKLYYIESWTMDKVQRKLYTVTSLRPYNVEVRVSLH